MEEDPSDRLKAKIRASIWATPSVLEQPSVSLIRWSVMQTNEGKRHFVGYNIDDREGRVSTEIISFDSETAQGVTRSGRTYQLVGPPGYDSDASWVWSLWANSRKLRWHDVTNEYETLKNEEPD